MPKFKVLIDDFTCYGATIEAEDMDAATEKFEQALEDCEYNYWQACEKFEAHCEDGSLETHWYEEDDE
jgi:hypothetical protein